MSMMKREPSPAQSAASRANSRNSTGPRTTRGKSVAFRNLPKARPFSQVAARSLAALGEDRRDFERMHDDLAESMAPRDAWEAAWIQDIAILRWRLERLQRAEAGMMALRRRRFQSQRLRAACPPGGSAGLEIKGMVSLVGFTSIPDSAMKFERVLDYLTNLRDIVAEGTFDQDAEPYLMLLYGTGLGPQGALLNTRYQALAKSYKDGLHTAVQEGREALVADLNKEIETYRQLQALHAAEHVEADQVQEDAELLLPAEELDQIMRYETHLEDQIDRKLRQFYARRRESVACPAEALLAAPEEASAGDPVRDAEAVADVSAAEMADESLATTKSAAPEPTGAPAGAAEAPRSEPVPTAAGGVGGPPATAPACEANRVEESRAAESGRAAVEAPLAPASAHPAAGITEPPPAEPVRAVGVDETPPSEAARAAARGA